MLSRNSAVSCMNICLNQLQYTQETYREAAMLDFPLLVPQSATWDERCYAANDDAFKLVLKPGFCTLFGTFAIRQLQQEHDTQSLMPKAKFA